MELSQGAVRSPRTRHTMPETSVQASNGPGRSISELPTGDSLRPLSKHADRIRSCILLRQRPLPELPSRLHGSPNAGLQQVMLEASRSLQTPPSLDIAQTASLAFPTPLNLSTLCRSALPGRAALDRKSERAGLPRNVDVQTSSLQFQPIVSCARGALWAFGA
jgi:hypothetical protein